MKWEDCGRDVAYLSFKDIEEGEVANSVSLPETGLILDFDEDGRLLGIETYNASSDLPQNVLDQMDSSKGLAERITDKLVEEEDVGRKTIGFDLGLTDFVEYVLNHYKDVKDSDRARRVRVYCNKHDQHIPCSKCKEQVEKAKEWYKASEHHPMEALKKMEQSPDRQEKFFDETVELAGLLFQRGDLRIGQFICNALARKEDVSTENLEDYLFSIEDDELVSCMSDYYD